MEERQNRLSLAFPACCQQKSSRISSLRVRPGRRCHQTGTPQADGPSIPGIARH